VRRDERIHSLQNKCPPKHERGSTTGWRQRKQVEKLWRSQELEKFDKAENGLLPTKEANSEKDEGKTEMVPSGTQLAPLCLMDSSFQQSINSKNRPLAMEQLKKSIDKQKQREKQSQILPSFWVPSLTPDAKPEILPKPPKHPVCPQGNHPLRMKELVKVKFDLIREKELEDPQNLSEQRYECRVCGNTFTNISKATLLKKCGHVFCTSCVNKFSDQRCFNCSVSFSSKHLIPLQTGGTGFAGHGVKLEATKFTPNAWIWLLHFSTLLDQFLRLQ